jgi:hypothetical protein
MLSLFSTYLWVKTFTFTKSINYFCIILAQPKFNLMKKLLLSLVVVASGFLSYGQAIVAGISPASVQGNYEFTWADPAGGDWTTLDLNIPGNFVQAELMLVDDGTTGNNATYGFPNSLAGCNALVNDLTGKIAVVYRADCQFGTKALNAETAGAVGVIIINHSGAPAGMAGGNDGASLVNNIPVVMISTTDGEALITEMGNGPVEMFIGNKTGLYGDDAGILANAWQAPLISKLGGLPSQLAQNAGEYSFELGARVYNYGTNAQSAVTLNATITGPSGVVYNNTTSAFTLNAASTTADSADVWSGGTVTLPNFDFDPANPLHVPGRYTLTYTLDLNGATDEYDGDNTYSADFVIQDEIYSVVQLDATTGLPDGNQFYQPGTWTTTFDACIVIDNPNASRLAVDGLYFSAVTSTASGLTLDGEEMGLYLYTWDDVFTDLNDANFPANTWTLNEVASGYYYYPSDLQGETVYGQFANQVALQDNQRYLACVQTVNQEVFLGFDNTSNVTWNVDTYLQPVAPVGNDGSYFAVGFGSDVPPAIGVRVFNAAELGINEEASIEGSAYPNPAVDVVTVAMDAEGSATLNITDLAGRTVASHTISLVAGKAQINVADLNSGAYIFNVVLEDGRTSQFNVVKK